ncbi:MAG: hypothetical protein AVDCRST_MAG71-794 [uncultured Lysobacter sp.]|uniref:Uncharacterized protein n=1 Tax=uncultured Lysobacter sp. TaxID=271060 RepID=A0A6J4KS67_9GAMM|nr:MAG: hypothetical protein AVDCRST_MAG71-794 [uncultured Lysobacter sp.]
MKRPLVLVPLLLAAFLAGPGYAGQATVIQAENVRYAYAQVLRVTPVYQTLTATRTERRCDPSVVDDNSKLSRVVGAVKDALRRDPSESEQVSRCRQVPVVQEFHRPIAYDVDYTYRGGKYRSRLPEDPGNRLRIRVSIMPMPGGPQTR